MVEELNSRRPRNNSTFPVIIIETVADFCAPFPFNVDFADDFMPKQTHETNVGGSETCIGETTQIILCFPDRDCSQQSKGNSNPESDVRTTHPRCLSGDVMKRSNYNDKGKKNKTYCLTVWMSLMLSSVNTKTNKISGMKVPKQTRDQREKKERDW